MKVNGTAGYEALKAYFNQVKKEREREKAPAAAREGADRLELSPAAARLAQYRAALNELPQVRAELVEELRREIAAGTYRADAGKIAEGILEELAQDKEALSLGEVRRVEK